MPRGARRRPRSCACARFDRRRVRWLVVVVGGLNQRARRVFLSSVGHEEPGNLTRWQAVCAFSRDLVPHFVYSRRLTTPERHIQICRKLLDTLHITPEERRELGGDRLLFSALISTAQAALDELTYLPSFLRPDHEFEGAMIEQRDNTYLVYECHEVGVGRYSPVKVRVAKDLRDALRAYVRANGGTAIDGVPINFNG